LALTQRVRTAPVQLLPGHVRQEAALLSRRALFRRRCLSRKALLSPRAHDPVERRQGLPRR
jgi:hypothetical protein